MVDVKKARAFSYWAKTLLPGPNGEPVSLSTLKRWTLDGRKDPDGNRVYLDAVRLGSRWVTD